MFQGVGPVTAFWQPSIVCKKRCILFRLLQANQEADAEQSSSIDGTSSSGPEQSKLHMHLE